MPEFTIEGFARDCKAAMDAAKSRQEGMHDHLARTLEECPQEEILSVLEARLEEAGVSVLRG